jgi:hypothetical protein
LQPGGELVGVGAVGAGIGGAVYGYNAYHGK